MGEGAGEEGGRRGGQDPKVAAYNGVPIISKSNITQYDLIMLLSISIRRVSLNSKMR